VNILLRKNIQFPQQHIMIYGVKYFRQVTKDSTSIEILF